MIKDITIKETKEKGKGVFALKDFKKGEFIFRSRRGKIIKAKDIAKLPPEKKNHINQIGKGIFELQPSPECYINHSCNPNVVFKGKSAYALKQIKKGEELTVDYRISALNEGWEMQCKCGSKNCSKVVKGDFFTLSPKLQRKYLPYAPKFIQEEYKRRRSQQN